MAKRPTTNKSAAKKSGAKKSTRKTGAAKRTAKPHARPARDVSDRIIDAALAAAVERGWAGLGLADIADQAGLSLSQVRREFSGKAAILAGYTRRIDLAVLDSAAADESLAGDPPRERLFDILMRRIDAMDAEKAALIAIAEDLAKDPLDLLCVLPLGPRSMAWMLAAANLPSTGVKGRLGARALAVAWAITVRTWFSDDDPDHGKTMAMLDRQIGRLDRLAGFCRPGAGIPWPRRQAADL